ncbi:sensor histidine kinase [Flavobacterium sp. Sd200]|uniref:tetratricopeptide repeat-containing sensor histidine kinase n=1 Tax=Flavobacterium sp. Sd200 TaxID=2692211 RepID=UPI00136B6739|nr:sensor histidine kinase [Flavobacterium sp. Sd200]
MNSKEVSQAEGKMASLPQHRNKVSQLLDISMYYFNYDTHNPLDLDKASKFALEALATGEAINYTKGIGQSYLQLSKISQEAKKYGQGKKYALKAVDVSKNLGATDLYGEALVMLWSTSTLTGASHQTGIRLIQNAGEAFKRSGNLKREGDCLEELADLYQMEGDYAKALIELKKAMELYKHSGFKKLQNIYELTGRVHLLMGNLDKGVECLVNAENTADAMGETIEFYSTLNNSIAMAYTTFGQPDKALPYIEKALQIAVELNRPERVEVILVNYVSILSKLQRTDKAIALVDKMIVQYPTIKRQDAPVWECMMADIYIDRKEFAKAAQYCEGIERKIKKNGKELNKDDIFDFISSIIRCNIALGNYKKALLYNTKYDSLCNIRSRVFCNTYHMWAFKIDSAAGNYVSAIKHYQQYKQVNDEMLGETKARQINQLNILHESEKKDKNILLLKEQAQSQENSLKSANFVRNTTLAGFMIMSVFIFIIYRNYRQNLRSNVILKSQKEEIDVKNTSLENLISEKEWLLKEIHHRVKNNLHMVVGLLASQCEFLTGKEAVQAINESQRRVEAMSIIHQKLYQSENLSMIDMPSYIYELTENLADSFDSAKQVRFQLDICNIEFPLSHSVPVGLILNEAITNAIKYAFPGEAEGVIDIVLKQEGKGFLLSVRDNGVGIDEHFSIDESPSLGLKLMQGLTGDMQGDFLIRNNNGTEIEIRFSINEDREAIPNII